MQKLWKFEWYLPYSLCVGLFKATDEEVRSLIGRTIYLGELDGKHSDVEGEIEEGEITLVSEDPHVVEAVPEIGYNPMEFLPECFE